MDQPKSSTSREIEESIEKESRPASVTVGVAARVAVLSFGLLCTLIGGGIVAPSVQVGGWWALGLGIVFLVLGCWWIWISVFGKSKSVAKVCDVYLFELLSHFF